MRTLALVALGFATSLTAACTDDPGGSTGTDGPCAAKASLCVTLSVPDDYAKTPVKVIVGLFEHLPPEGPPNGIAAIVENPVIGPGAPLALQASNVMPAGDWFVYAVLYDEGGGKYQPVADVDYVVESTEPFHIGERAVNMPAMALSLFTK